MGEKFRSDFELRDFSSSNCMYACVIAVLSVHEYGGHVSVPLFGFFGGVDIQSFSV